MSATDKFYTFYNNFPSFSDIFGEFKSVHLILFIFFVVASFMFLSIMSKCYDNGYGNGHDNDCDNCYDNGCNNNNQNSVEIEEGFDNNNNKIITLYYAPWCGYSRDFLPEWDKFEKYVNNNNNINNRIRATKVDCSSDNSNNSNNKCRLVDGYPTVLCTEGGKDTPYEGERTFDGLKELLN